MTTKAINNTHYNRSLIEASIDSFVVVNLEGKITDVNQAFIKATGITRVKLINTDFSNHFNDSIKAKEAYLKVFKKGFVIDYPLTLKHKNGNLTDIS